VKRGENSSMFSYTIYRIKAVAVAAAAATAAAVVVVGGCYNNVGYTHIERGLNIGP
jgi:hypothetical protein